MNKARWTFESCLKLYNELDLEKSINICDLSEKVNMDSIEDNIESLIHDGLLTSNIDVDKYDYNITIKSTEKGYFHNWHIDGFRVDNLKKRLGIGEYEWKPIFNPIPELSMLIYLNDYGKDFKGGILELVNGMRIYPKRGLTILFNSKLGHRVTNQNGGIRKFILILFHRKTD